jgi:hypothetical protein
MDRSRAAVLRRRRPPSDGATAPNDAISSVFTGDTVLVDSELEREVGAIIVPPTEEYIVSAC